ncbi:MAG TPA: undecaprenyldiphospho-muramoylpentapeptide beta-N-acetylglucosaminyltransferase [Bacteroidales bacterium]|nr:undecaprenyldiphospho-muramoylpentapeptide beta-N-acetylglucosaminyltransferase [Bacteroidales bacterium]
MYRNLKIMISGGGTGGHVFPAIAIADAVRVRFPDAEILFAGATGKMEMEKVPAAGYSIIGLPVRGLQRRLALSNLEIPFRLIVSLIRSVLLIRNFKPHAVAGAGGYASWPLLQAASWCRIPYLIQEQNSYAGIANRMLAKNAACICVAWKSMERFFPASKIVLCGNPVRSSICCTTVERKEAAAHFGLNPENPTVLVTGGSLGARTINESIAAMLDYFSENQHIQLIWQCGKSFFSQAKSLAAHDLLSNVRVFEFINRMDFAYAMADVVVSRAGAIALAELSLLGKAAILIPSPNVAEDHQTHNAMALVKDNAALMIPDNNAKERLQKVLPDLLSHAETRLELKKNILNHAYPGAADSIAEELIRLAGFSNKTEESRHE